MEQVEDDQRHENGFSDPEEDLDLEQHHRLLVSYLLVASPGSGISDKGTELPAPPNKIVHFFPAG
jgi:hypothetical protein